MRIGGIGGPVFAPVARRSSGEARAGDTPETESRALIALDAPAPSDGLRRLTGRPTAGFLAQLIATRMQAPQTRERRRAEPAEAIAVYRTMTKPVISRRAFGRRA
jgi:hypothetical protein